MTDEKKQGLNSATVQVYEDHILKGGTRTDQNGYYEIQSLSPGTYTVKVRYVGKLTLEIQDVPLENDITVRKLDILLDANSFEQEKGKVIRTVTMPFFDPSEPGTQIMRGSDMKHLPIQ